MFSPLKGAIKNGLAVEALEYSIIKCLFIKYS